MKMLKNSKHSWKKREKNLEKEIGTGPMGPGYISRNVHQQADNRQNAEYPQVSLLLPNRNY